MSVDSANRIFQSWNAFREHKNLLLDSKSVVFTNGCFDILHVGHVEYLERSRQCGDILIVGLNHDDSVRQLKGAERPINEWKSRAIILKALSCVDIVIGFGEETPIDLIRLLRPNIITKGGDYKMEDMIGREYVESYGGEVVIFPFVGGYSTTEIIRKLER